jgi:predicted RNA-binding Zn-ribbon protein involved in translation (DUF1610 family)
MPDQTPKYLPENCPHCGVKVWHVLSRVTPESFTEDEFLQRYEVDEASHAVRDKYAEVEARIHEAIRNHPRFNELMQVMENLILYGDSKGQRPTGLIVTDEEQEHAGNCSCGASLEAVRPGKWQCPMCG